MRTRRSFFALLAAVTSLIALACGGEDERQTPNCPDASACFTAPDGGTPVSTGGSGGSTGVDSGAESGVDSGDASGD